MAKASADKDKTSTSAWWPVVFPAIRRAMGEVVVISLFVNIFTLALPVFVLQVYDRVVTHNAISTLKALAIGLAIVLFFDFLLRQTRSRMLQWSAARVDGCMPKRRSSSAGASKA